MISPHGGRLIDRYKINNAAVNDKLPKINLGDEDYINLENIATGVYSPLEGFMGKDEYVSVLERGRLLNDLAWTIPILLNINEEQRSLIEKEQEVLLSYNGNIVGILFPEEFYSIDPRVHSEKVYGTNDKNHPGVAKVYAKEPMTVAGKIELYKRPDYPVFTDFHLTPKETRLLFQERGWKKVVAFQTRNVPHMGHEYVQKSALTIMDGLFINPIMGKKKKGDFKDEVILNSYDVLIKNYYPKERAVMSVLTYEMHYAGPREAIFHAIMRKNFGCTHFIVGRDHAGVGNYYGAFDAHKIFDNYPDLNIEPIFFKSFFYCKKCASIANDKTCSHDESYIINFAGTQVRNAIVEGKRPQDNVMRPEVADEILKYENPFVD